MHQADKREMAVRMKNEAKPDNSQRNKWYLDFYSKPFAMVTYTDLDIVEKQWNFLKTIAPKIDDKTKIFDQCCGNGIFARRAASAAENPVRVLGIDISKSSIKIAKEAQPLFKNLEYRVADALYYCEDNEFDIATCWHTSCAYSIIDAENIKQFDCLSKSLKRGGVFVIDTINPEYVYGHFIDRKCRIEDDGTIIATRYHLAGNILSSTWKITSFENDKVSTCFGFTKMYSMSQYEKMLNDVGLKLIGCFGDYDGRALSCELGRMILHGVKL